MEYNPAAIGLLDVVAVRSNVRTFLCSSRPRLEYKVLAIASGIPNEVVKRAQR